MVIGVVVVDLRERGDLDPRVGPLDLRLAVDATIRRRVHPEPLGRDRLIAILAEDRLPPIELLEAFHENSALPREPCRALQLHRIDGGHRQIIERRTLRLLVLSRAVEMGFDRPHPRLGHDPRRIRTSLLRFRHWHSLLLYDVRNGTRW